jgi:hypothetical protein
LFLYLAGKYGLTANVPLAEGPGARQLQQIEIASGIAFFAIYAWSVVDALLHFRPSVQIEGDDSLLQQLRDRPPDNTRPLAPPPPPTRKSFLDRLHVSPMISRDSAGIGLRWEND